MRGLGIILTLVAVAPCAQAAFHVMQIEEVIGGLRGLAGGAPNTSAQAIQLRMRSSGQNLVANAKLWAWDSTGANRILLLDIASNVAGSASGSRVLLATSAFTSTMIARGATTFTPDFTLANAIPLSYLTAGRLTFEDDGGSTATPGTIYWSVAWGGAGYTGSVTGSTQNDTDGNFGPAFSLGLRENTYTPGLVFTGAPAAPSTTNAADYRYMDVNETVIKNNGTVFVIVPEPGSVALLAAAALGLGGLIVARRRGWCE